VKKLIDIDIIVEYLIQNGVLETLLPKYVEKLKHHTISMIEDIQNAMTPCIYNIDAHRVYGYRYDGREFYLRTPNTMIFMCKNIPYLDKRRRDSIFVESMVTLVENQEITPFLLFINGRAVKWSNVTIIRDWSFSFIIISNCKTYADSLDCVLFPCTIRYGENNNILPNCTTGLYFDYNGFYTTNPNKVNLRIEVTDKHVAGGTYRINESYPHIELLEPNERQTSFPENILTFESDDRFYADGRFYLDHYGENIYTYARETAGVTFRSFYYTESNESKNMIFDIPNQYETKISLKDKAAGKDDHRVDDFLSQFDFKFSRNKTYERNVSEAVSYIITYKMQLLIDFYKNKMNIRSYSFTGSRINELAALHNGTLIMHRDRSKKLFDYIIVFVNGKLYDNYHSINYTNNYFEIPISNINDTDSVEIIHFKKVNNTSKEIIITDEIDYIPEELRYDNFELFATCKYDSPQYLDYSEDEAKSQYPITDFSYANQFNEYGNYTGSVIALGNTYFKNKSLRLISKRQFHYYHYDYTSANDKNKIELPKEFKFCTNNNQFLVFKNKLLFNDWRLVHPYILTTNGESFDMAYIHSNIDLLNGDIIDIFYIPDAYEEILLDPRDPSISGYNDIILDTSMLDIPFDNSLFFVYANGKKVSMDNVQNVAINRVRLRTEITEEGNITIHRLFNADTILKEVFSYSDKWSKAVSTMSNADYATLFTIAENRSK